MPYCQQCGAELAGATTTCTNCGAAVAQEPGAGETPSWKKPFFITLAVGCGCGGLFLLTVLSAILIPNALDAIKKAKQKRTVADIRSVGTGMMLWRIDELDADNTTVDLDGDRAGGSWSVEGGHSYRRVSYDRIVALLVPDYLQVVPELDAWGHELEFAINDDLLGAAVLSIRSPGGDGLFDTDLYPTSDFVATDYARDVVWADGYFVRWPQGLSQ